VSASPRGEPARQNQSHAADVGIVEVAKEPQWREKGDANALGQG
jgi:hypothetical protein